MQPVAPEPLGLMAALERLAESIGEMWSVRCEFVCPLPVPGRDGQALRELCGRHAAITTFLPGVWPRRVRPEHCAPVGDALASLHLAGTDYAPTRRNALGPEAWAPLLEKRETGPK